MVLVCKAGKYEIPFVLLTNDDKMTVMVTMDVAETRKILVVEDDSLTAEVMLDALTAHSYDVRLVSNPKEAFEEIANWCPHLVLTDHDMPGLSGLDLLRQLRKKDNYVTVIFVSGRKDTHIIVNALREGADDFIRKPFSNDELVARVEVSLRGNDVHRELKEKNEKLEKMVELDDLTGLFNMRSIYQKIDMEISRSKRQESSTAVIMMDMDYFKSVNDENDHLFGSFVLQQVGEIIKSSVREYDFAARYGGDEFLICLVSIEKDDLSKFCERLRKRISKNVFSDGKNSKKLTCSLGVALLPPNQNLDARELVRCADHALYRAKDNGRDRVELEVLSLVNSGKLTAS